MPVARPVHPRLAAARRPARASRGRAARGLDVAIIMDGNGRWAAARGMPRILGHRAGVEVVRRVVEAAPPIGIRRLTLYAFSSDNWRRPAGEVRALLALFATYLRAESRGCRERGVRLRVIGRRDRLSSDLREAVESAERATARGRRLELRIALDYSARDAILGAARRAGPGGALDRERFGRLLAAAIHGGPDAGEVDLLVRTGGEQRLSDFLLWECAYAELYFTRTPWPDFTSVELAAAVREFRRRDRRFGGIPAARRGAEDARGGVAPAARSGIVPASMDPAGFAEDR
jgi:undecaprenyl diphosphate synthase